MSRITEEMIRRKAEHHDGLLCDLEEISLHQLEIEKLEVIGTLCRKLKILYLQNNIIPRIENVHHLKELRYLNLALNNVTLIEGLHACEFLNKLDLTVNFIDVDNLEASVEHLAGLLHLRELYLMGNPCLEWEGARLFIVASLPQLARLDGKDIVRSERIAAVQAFSKLREDLRVLAQHTRLSKGVAVAPSAGAGGSAEADEAWTPESRVRMYKEMAESKAETEKRKKDMAPQKRDHDDEQKATVGSVREAEAAGAIKQTNQGRWDFTLEDEDGAGNSVLRIQLSKYLDTSLIDVDVNPTYVSIIIKSKIFRVAFPQEVRASEAKCQRSQTTGELAITIPKVKVNPILATARKTEKMAAEARAAPGSKADPDAGSARTKKLGEELIEASKAVSLTGITRAAVLQASAHDSIPDGSGGTMLFKEHTSTLPRTGAHSSVAVSKHISTAATSPAFVDDEDVPPLE